MNNDFIEIEKIKNFDGENKWYWFIFKDFCFVIIPKNTHKYNRIAIKNDLGKYDWIIEDDFLRLQLLEKYNLQNSIDIILNIASLNFKEENEKYKIPILKKIILTPDIEIDRIDLDSINNLGKTKISLEPYQKFLNNFKDKLNNQENEKQIEEFIINNKNKIPFFKIHNSQVPMINEWEEERKIDITFNKFMNVTSDILELKKSNLRVLQKINGDNDNSVRFFLIYWYEQSYFSGRRVY